MRWLIAAVVIAGSSWASSPPISISLETGWSRPPLILEILETVYDEQPSAYFPFLSLLSTHLPSLVDASDAVVLSRSIDLISSHRILSTPSALSTFQYALGLHTAAPRVEALYSWYNSTVDEKTLAVEGCESWVLWRGKAFCDAIGLRRDVEMSIEDGTVHRIQSVPTLSIDHVSPGSAEPEAVLYLDVSSLSSMALLEYLERHAKAYPTFRYVARYKPAYLEGGAALSGYGVELALKKTDYLVVDDRALPGDGKQIPFSPSSVAGPFDDTLGKDPWSELATPLRPTELADISIKAATLIMSSPNPLEALQHVAQDFPKYSAAIARRITVTQAVEDKMDKVMLRGGHADPGLYISGKSVGEQVNAFSLLKDIREERRLALSLVSLGFTPQQAYELISDPLIGQAQTEDDVGEGIVDASDRLEGEDVIIWWNDIEKDKRYEGWPTALSGLMRPLYPGQLHTVRKNIWHVVLVLDLSQGTALETVANAVSTMIQRGVPLRFGVVPMYDADVDDIANKMAKLFAYSVKTFGRGLTRDLLTEIAQRTPSSPTVPGIAALPVIQAAYEGVAMRSGKSHLSFGEMLAAPQEDEAAEKSSQYTTRLAATRRESPQGHVFVNGKHSPFDVQWTSFLQQELSSQLRMLQEQLAVGISPKNVSTFFYDLPGVPARRSLLITPGSETKLKLFNLLDVFEMDSSTLEGKLANDFVYSSDGSRGAPVTMWLVADLDSNEGRRVARDALLHLTTEQCSSRLGFVHVPTAGAAPASYQFSTIIYHLLSVSGLRFTDASHLLSLLDELDVVETDWKTWSEKGLPAGSPLHALTSSGWEFADAAAAERFWEIGRDVARRLGLKNGTPHVLVNGRLVGPLTKETFPAGDFDALELYEHRKRVRPVIDLVSTMFEDMSKFNRAALGNIVSRASSVLAAAYKSADAEGIFLPTQVSRNRLYEKLDDGALSFHLGDDNALIRVVAVLDPVSEIAQRWSSLLRVVAKLENVAVSVYLEPTMGVQEIKLKRFYRTSLDSKPLFDVDGSVVAPPLVFSDLPTEPIYTLGMDTPSAWITRPVSSPYDLDNLVLDQQAIQASFHLTQLVVEGHAREGANVPTRGVQLQLTRDDHASDTLVMANLGYFQFKVTPGVYDLSIRPGRGREVFELESAGTEGWDSRPVNETGTGVTLASFDGVTLLPTFKRKDGMERADVLMDVGRGAGLGAEEGGSVGKVFSKMKELVGIKSHAAAAATRHADVNIFTVASGLLYERFASIMILSVMKHTQSSVKFWFIENFLSPSFIAFLPHLAEEYGFQYELVTYKWPHWLRAQTEKQRIIWAYKILFLDVLFPMDLDKVIFVDADQIVRTDMKELIDVDLHGSVYGYAPMGNSRTEMEGFRFWKTGYWLEALRGRPYHISALYVVDLKRFRQLATGDRLRGQYHALSADPHSLANLDQDLPNSMQDQIPIFTLDQDWLWCQTWCSDESLATAKTIDLCQNPLTKEPKLVRARQIPEWDSYDQEVARVAKRVERAGGRGLAASVDELAGDAGVGAGVVASVEEGEVDDDEAKTKGHVADEL